jgi:hypothetical protein
MAKTRWTFTFCALATMLPQAASAGQRAYYECTLQQALTSGRDVRLLLETEDGQVRQHAVAIPGDSYAACRVREHGLKVAAGRLSGPMRIQIGDAVEKVDLDVALDKAGTYAIAHGLRKAEGKVAIEAPEGAASPLRVLWLQDAMGAGSPLTLPFEVNRSARTVTARKASAERYNKSLHPVDAARLAFDGANLEGEIGITIVPDGWTPADKQPVEGVIRLRASLDGKDKGGTYSAAFGAEKLRQGHVASRPITEGRMRDEVAPVLGRDAPWRVWLVTGQGVARNADGELVPVPPVGNRRQPQGYDAGTAQLSDLPAEDWTHRDYDDSLWGRYADDLYEFIGGYGAAAPRDALLCLRTWFGVSDPTKAAGVTVTVEYLGGAVVYVNGVEVGRGHVAEGKLQPHVPAADYPVEAYTVDDGSTPLPVVGLGARPEPKWLPRYQARVRTMTAPVPSKLLVKGGNVLAVEVRRSAACGPMQQQGWSHLAVRGVNVSSPSGAGLMGYAEACRGTRVWSAQELEQVTARPVARWRIAGGWARGVMGVRGMPIVGISAGNPYEPVRPVRILVPRNGVGCGQAVLADGDGLRGVRATVRDLVGPDKAALPARVQFASQGGDIHWCDNLLDKPEDGATTLPVWLSVQAPRNQAPGWYVSTLSLEANGRKFDVPVQVFVTGYAVPDARDLRSLMGVMHSPDATAAVYGVPPWSEEHFKVMARSLELAGQLGGDIMYVPVLIGQHMGHRSGLIRWVRTDKGLQPDFGLFEKYLDLYVKYCSPPKAMSLYVWSADSAKELANAYEGRAIMTMAKNPQAVARVTQWDPKTGATESAVAPTFLDEGAEAFWKPMLDGVQAIVKKRGWSERIIMLGLGSDFRPSQKTGELLRRWAPYARWDIYSHFSGDPGVGGGPGFFYKGPPPAGSAPGKMVAIGDLEVGVKEHPWGSEKGWIEKLDFLDLPLQRGHFYDQSPPMSFRTWPLHSGRLARVGLEFWPEAIRYQAPIWGVYPIYLAGRGADGPVPTVRLRNIQQSLQEFEPRLTILEALAKLPPEEQKTHPHRALLDDLHRRMAMGGSRLSQTELNLNWPAYAARVYRAAEELSGVKTQACWENPPR